MSTRAASKRLRSRAVPAVQQVEEDSEGEEALEEEDEEDEEDDEESLEQGSDEEDEDEDAETDVKKKKTTKKKPHVCDTCHKGFGAKSDLQVNGIILKSVANNALTCGFNAETHPDPHRRTTVSP